jgi:amino acid adenylation domain-containing protein/FkbM family methyltransferase
VDDAARLRAAAAIEELVAPASFAQERLWFLSELAADRPIYNLGVAFRLRGELAIEALERAINTVVERHEVLRTVLRLVDGELVQIVAAPTQRRLRLVDLSASPTARAEAQARIWCEVEVAKQFDLGLEAPIRYSLLQLGQQDFVLLFVIHHICFDAWSARVLRDELAQLYMAAINGGELDLPALGIQYADFASWQRTLAERGLFEQQIEYWRQQLAGAPMLSELSTDRPRPAAASFQGAEARTLIGSDVTAALANLARENRASLFMTIFGAFATLLGRYANVTDLVIGTPVAGRTRPELEPLIGLFVNTLPLRIDLSGRPSFLDLLARVRESALQGYENQDVPFERVVRALQPERSLSHTPLFQVALTVDDARPSPHARAGVFFEPFPVVGSTAAFDVAATVRQVEHGLLASFEYATDLFDGATVERMAGHFRRLVEGVVADPARPVGELPLLGHEERSRILVEWNQTERSFPEQSVAALVEEQVARTPDAIAVSFGSSEVTYRELNERANRSAHHLQASGVGPETIVAVFLDRSVELVVALLAVLKAGGAYLPLEPGYPQERLRFMLADAGADVIVSVASLAESLPPQRAPVILLDRDLPEIAARSCANPLSHVRPENLAYMIYTSGSTGKPKGVLNTHRGIVNRLIWMQDTFRLEQDDAVLQKTPIGFDVSVWEFFWPLIVGARLVLAPPGVHRDPQRLAQAIAEQRVTTVHFVPSMLRAFLPGTRNECGTLKRVICSGEALTPDLAQMFFTELDCELNNLYGPTEAAIDVVAWRCEPSDAERVVPIGRPVANTQAYVLDELFEPVPPGVIGELFIGGVQVARGYHGRPALTAERFVPDPFGVAPGARLYRTGDLARYRPDGAIEFCGRVDDQIKIRGFRVEPAEIEKVLTQHPALAVSAVVPVTATDGLTELHAYVVPDPGASLLGRLARLHLEPHRGREVIDLPNGMTVFHLNRGETQFLYEEIFERRGYVQHGIVVPQGAVVFDVGANIGLFSLFVGEIARDATIYAFEPIPEAAAILRLNAELHGLDCTVLEHALGATDGTETFTFFPRNSILSGRKPDLALERSYAEHFLPRGTGTTQDRAALLDEVMRGAEIVRPVRCFSSVIAEHGIDRIDLLKIDVEGDELDVIRGLSAENWRIIEQIVLESHREDHLEEIVHLLQRQGLNVEVEAETRFSDGLLHVVYGRRGSLAPASSPKLEWQSVASLVEDIRAHVGERLPDPMIPAAIHVVEELPTSPNGKLDRARLPQLSIAVPALARTPARSAAERELATIWGEVLGRTDIALEDSFFDCGGHSLLAVKLVARLGRDLGVRLPLSAVFEVPTLGAMARLLTDGSTRVSEPIITLHEGEGSDVVFVHPAGGEIGCYMRLGRLLAPSHVVRAVRAPALCGDAVAMASVPAYARRYVDLLRGVNREPAALAGWSVGGVLAFEMARQMLRQSRHAPHVILLDTHFPSFRDARPPELLRREFIRDLGRALNLPHGTFDAALVDCDETTFVTVIATRLTALGIVELGDAVDSIASAYRLFQTTIEAVAAYAPKPYDGPVSLLRTRDGSYPEESVSCWRAVASRGLVVQDVPGSHFTMLDDPNVGVIGREIEAALGRRDDLPSAKM